MKIRTQHVSNSSTSSYIIAGFDKDDVDVSEFKLQYEGVKNDKDDDFDLEGWEDERYDVVVGDLFYKLANGEYIPKSKLIGAGIVVHDVYSGSLENVTEVLEDKADIVNRLRMVGIKVKEDATMKIFVYGTWPGA
jgi:hypothetical protein